MKKQLTYGGGGGGGKVTYLADNLRSQDTGEMLLGLCEGPIVGLEDGEKSFFLDDTPLVSSDGSKNFTDYSLRITNGDPFEDETIKFQLGGSARSTSVGLELKHNSPVTRVTQTGEIDFIDVKILVQALYYSDDEGTRNATVTFRIEYKRQDQDKWTVYTGKDLSISGKTQSGYMKEYRIPVERNDKFYYEVRITKISEESSTSGQGEVNNIQWSSFEEVVSMEKEFKNTAMAHLIIKTSDQVTQLPKMSGIYKFLKVKVPSNYDPIEKVYVGEWDGTFKIAWTDNPAWCLYDLIMNDRYGVNAYYPVTADKWDFYDAAKYCDEKVPDGKGGREPRYTLNIVIEEAQSGPEMINYIASIFNATIYEDASGYVRLAFEKDQQATHIFTLENVTPAGFAYTFTDPATRYNDLTVTFMNSERNWIEDRRRVCDNDSIETWGRITENYIAVGCIKESEAIRRARYRLITHQSEIMSVSFTTTVAAYNINVFDTILVADKNMGYSMSGRIKSISDTRNSIELRDSLFIEAGVDYYIDVQMPEGIISVQLNVREVGYVTTLYLNDILPDNVPEFAVFTLRGENSGLGEAKPFRVTGISEAQDGAGGITVNAIEINRNKQREADEGLYLPDSEYSKLPSYQQVPHVKDVKFSEYYASAKKETQLTVSPILDNVAYPYYTGSVRVWSRPKGDENWQERTVLYGDTIVNHPGGLYEFIVLPETTLGSLPPFDTAPIFEYTVSDLGKAPMDVRNFKARANVNNIVFTWDRVQDVDLVGYELRKGDLWDTAEIVAEFLTGTEYIYTEPLTIETGFLIKAVDSFGVYSENASYTTAALGRPKDVKNFYVTPHQDNLRFDWVAEQENQVEYEIRVGESWDSGIELFKTASFNHTILNPGYGDKGFMIKAVSSAGVYSENDRYAEARMELFQDRNVILKIDNAADGWEGVTNGMEKTEYENIIAMKQGVFFAEHYFGVHLPEVTRARNWYETEGFRYGSKLTFEDLDFMWGSSEAKRTTWLNSTSITSASGSILPVITYALSTNYNRFLGFRFMESTSDITNAVVPEKESNVDYGDARYAKGLILNRILDLDYKLVDLEDQFTLKHKLKVTQGTISNVPIMRLETNDGKYMDVSLTERKYLNIVRSDGVSLKTEITTIGYVDYVYLMIRQRDEKLTLDYFVEYANIRDKVEVSCKPLGSFTKLYIGGRYG